VRALRLPVFSLLIIAAVILSIPVADTAGFDLSKLDSRIDLHLADSSMADAAYALSEAAGIDIAAPAEPKDGLTASLKQETLRDALNTLEKMSGLAWHIENTVVVLKRPVTLGELPPPPKRSVTPHEGMTAFLTTLDEGQLFLISRGAALPYSDLTPAQQEIIKSMLVPAADTTIPKPEDVSIAFRVIPQLVVPKTTGGNGMVLRLDSMPYVTLGGKEGE